MHSVLLKSRGLSSQCTSCIYGQGHNLPPWSNSCHGDCKDFFWILDDVAYSQWIEWWKCLQTSEKNIMLLHWLVDLVTKGSLKILGDTALGQRGSDKDLCYQGSGLGRVQKHRVRSAAGQRWTLRLWPRLMRRQQDSLASGKSRNLFVLSGSLLKTYLHEKQMQRETQTTRWFPFTPWFRLLWRNLAVLTNVLQQRIRLLQVLSWKKKQNKVSSQDYALWGFKNFPRNGCLTWRLPGVWCQCNPCIFALITLPLHNTCLTYSGNWT